MNPTNPPCPRRRFQSAGFTLVELLVVISIIAVLLGILIPVIDNMREQAQAANTLAGIQQIGAIMQAYQGDHNAYPGPIPNNQLRGAGNNLVAGIGQQITMAENVYLGLMGGLRLTTVPPAAPAFAFEPTLAGKGPQSLGSTPKKVPAYGDYAEVSAGNFSDEAGDGDDSIVPEFLDRFPSAMPLLILRARPVTATVGSANGAPIVTALPTAVPPAQYDQTQVTPYTGQVGGASIGEGKSREGDWAPAPAPNAPLHHGFNDPPNVNAVRTPAVVGDPNYFYPYNIHAALKHPTIANTPKQANAFIIISAGIDRVYGTQDDITNFGQY